MTWFLCLSLEASFQHLLPQQLLCQQSICRLSYGAAFKMGLPTLSENFEGKEFRGVRALSSIPSPAGQSLPSVPAPPASPRPLVDAETGRAGAGSWGRPLPAPREGVHVARRPAGGTGGDRCHGSLDLFLQEECKQLIVSLSRSDLSTVLPRGVERGP